MFFVSQIAVSGKSVSISYIYIELSLNDLGAVFKGFTVHECSLHGWSKVRAVDQIPIGGVRCNQLSTRQLYGQNPK